MAHLTEEVLKKWTPIIEHKSLSPIKDSYKKSVTATILETTERVLNTPESLFENNVAGNDLAGNAAATTSGTSLANFTPVLINLIRRAVPQLIAFDVCGVQAMTAPTGLIFALKSGYANSSSAFTGEALFNEADSSFTGTGSQDALGYANTLSTLEVGLGIRTAAGEVDDAWPQAGFSIEKQTVDVKTRRIRADYTTELAQDLKAVHNLDAESELTNILTTEISADINREITRLLYAVAKPGGINNTASVDLAVSSGSINGRYFAEQWRGLQFLIERDAIAIAKDTRRGKGNFVIVDSETASALVNAGRLDYSGVVNANSALNGNVDETSSTFAGTLDGGRIKVYIDPYISLGVNFYLVGYKGSSPYDAGLFYCPYVPLQMVRAQDPLTFQPAIGFKTRYGLTEHPFSGSTYASAYGAATRTGTRHQNKYYRISEIKNLI